VALIVQQYFRSSPASNLPIGTEGFSEVDMSAGACVKGTIFQNVVNEIHQHLQSGALARADLEADCKPHDLDLLDQEIGIASWYPADTYGRFLRSLCDRIGGGRREFLVEGGRESARRVIEMGVYSQLSERTERWEERVGRILVTLSGSFYNFGEWRWQGLGNAGFRIEVRECAALPEEAALRAQGFIEMLACRSAGRHVAVDYERPRPSLIVFSADTTS
jgi:hypothetical protein